MLRTGLPLTARLPARAPPAGRCCRCAAGLARGRGTVQTGEGAPYELSPARCELVPMRSARGVYKLLK